MIKIYNVVLALVLWTAFSCGQKKESNEEYVVEEEVAADSDEWPELDEFHMIMAESYHPYKDSLNIDPAKANAEEMATIASRWVNASLPAKVNNDDVKTILGELKTEANEFATLVEAGNADDIGAALTHLHDTFHKIQEQWYGGGEKHTEEESEEH